MKKSTKTIGITKHELMQTKHIKREIAMWKEALEKCTYDLSLQSPCLENKGKISGTSDKTARIAEKIIDIKKAIEQKTYELQVCYQRSIDYINSVDDSLMRQVLYSRFVLGLDWTAIASATGGYNTPDNLRVSLDRFLKSNNYGQNA